MTDRTCKNCKYQVGIYKHPWNKQEWSKGSCNELIAFGCSVEDDMEQNGSIILMESDSGRCEMHEFEDSHIVVNIKNANIQTDK